MSTLPRPRRTQCAALHVLSDGAAFHRRGRPRRATPNGWARCRATPRSRSISTCRSAPSSATTAAATRARCASASRSTPTPQRLIEEIALLAPLKDGKLTHLHWGGGTPSILGPQWLETIAARLASLFDLSDLQGTRHRARPAPARQAAAAHAGRDRRQPRQPRRAGCFAPRAATDRPGAAVRDGGARGRGLARGRHRKPEHRSDVRPARPGHARGGAQRRAFRFAQSAAAGAVRLCPCAVVQDPPAADRGSRAAGRGSAAGAGAGRRRDLAELRLSAHRPRPFRPAR